MAFAAALPNSAQAACQNNIVGQNRTCTDTFAGDSFTPTTQPWAYTFLGAPNIPANSTAAVAITNNGDWNGTFTMDAGTSIALSGNANALVISNSNPVDSFVTLNLNGSITNNNAPNANFDALRLQGGWNYEVNIGTTGVLVGNDDAIVVTAIANNVTINNAGTVTARGQAGGANGGEAIIIAQGGTQNAKVAGSVNINNTGTLESLGTTLGGQAVHAAATGAISLTNDYRYNNDGEHIADTGQILGGTEGMRLVSATSIIVSNKAYIEAASGDGIQAVVDGTTGGITITNDVSDDGEEGEIIVMAAGASGGDGIDADITNAGNTHGIAVTNKGHIDAEGHGISTNHAGTGTTTIKNLSTNSIISILNGIDAIGAGGAIEVFNGDGGIDNPDGYIEAGQIGINASNTNGGSIAVWNGAAAGSISEIFADGEYGILAVSSGIGIGSGIVSVNNFGLVQAQGANAEAGVRAVASGAVDDSYVYFQNGALSGDGTLARINAFGIDDTDPDNPVPLIYDADGVELRKLGGTGGMQIGAPSYGAVFYNTGAWNFFANPGSDYLLDADLGGGIFAPGGSAVSVIHTGDSDTFLFNNGTIIGEGSSSDPVIEMTTAYNNITPNRVLITNGINMDTGTIGVIGSSALPSFFTFGGISRANLLNADLTALYDASNDHLLHASAGAPVFLDNSGILTGRVTLETDAGNQFQNFGVWFTRGISRFYGGDSDTLENLANPFAYGIIQTAFDPGVEEYTEFRGLNTFQNQGLLNMIDRAEGDITRTTGNYIGQDGRLGVDAYLGAPGSRSDVFEIGGDSSDVTGIIVNDTNPGPGYYNPTGILVVQVEGTTLDNNQTSPPGNFYLANGPIDKGFFTYDLYRVENSVEWYLASGPNARAFELAQLVTGAQTIWHETSVWLDRTADLRRTADCAVTPYGVAPNGPGGEGPCYQGLYGTWARAFGADFDRSTTNSISVLGTPSVFSGNYGQNLWGFEGGADMMVVQPSSGNGLLWLGALAGYVASDMRFDTTSDKAEFRGAMLGVYATYVNGPWYADLMFKADLLDVDYRTTFAGASASSNVNTYGLRLDTGYRFNLAQGLFVDPQGTIAWANTDFDNISLLGASANFGSYDSVRGRLGGRIGASWVGAGGIFEPFVGASVWHEFQGDNSVAIASGPLVVAVADNFDDTWGEVGGGINWFNNDGTSIFFKGDALVGGELTGFNLRGGGRIGW